MNPDNEKQEHTDAHDPNLLAAVGGYHNRRRPGWYIALVLLGFGLGAVLALAVSSLQSRDVQKSPVVAETEDVAGVREGLTFSTSDQFTERSPDMFAAGIAAVYIHLRLPDVTEQTELTGVVKLDGQEFTTLPPDLFIGETNDNIFIGKAILSGPKGQGLQRGIYEVEVRAGDGLAYEASFVVVEDDKSITAQAASKRVGLQVSEATMCTGTTQLGEPQERRDTFAVSEERICLAFHFANAQPGSAVNVEWLYADEIIPSGSSEIVLEAEEGWGYAWIKPKPETPLLTGAYRAVVRTIPDGELLVDRKFTVVEKTNN